MKFGISPEVSIFGPNDHSETYRIGSKRIAVAVCAALAGLLLLPSPGMAANTLCKVVEVASYGNRTHIKCEKAASDGQNQPRIIYFAVNARRDDPAVDHRFANRAIVIGTTAQVSQKTLRIDYDPADATSGAQFGCLGHDCRPIHSIAITEAPPP